MEFSKKVLLIAYVTFIAIVGGLFVLMWKTGDLSPATEIVIGVSTVLTAGTSFYFWKAKAENIVKINKRESPEVAEKLMEVLRNGLGD